VRILPEIEMPGHSASWGFGYPELAVPWGEASAGPDADAGHDAALLGTTSSQLDPPNERTFAELIEAVVQELAEISPDEHMHLCALSLCCSLSL
jgi:hexosaminidase